MTVIAVAGRRVDADPDGERFPLRNADRVRTRLGEVFDRSGARTLVVSAACGTDLLAIEAARARLIRFRIILPFAAAKFRATSVVDRPGDWGASYDVAIEEARGRDDLIELPSGNLSDEAAYLSANERLIGEACALAASTQQPAIAVIATEGELHDGEDVTADFARRARKAGLEVVNISTLA